MWYDRHEVRDMQSSAFVLGASLTILICKEKRIMAQDAKKLLKKPRLGAENKAYDIIAQLDPEYFEKLKGLYVDGTFGREGALPRKTKELIMVGICCALNRPRGVRLHSERALTLGAAPRKSWKRWKLPRSPAACRASGSASKRCKKFMKTKGIEFK